MRIACANDEATSHTLMTFAPKNTRLLILSCSDMLSRACWNSRLRSSSATPSLKRMYSAITRTLSTDLPVSTLFAMSVYVLQRKAAKSLVKSFILGFCTTTSSCSPARSHHTCSSLMRALQGPPYTVRNSVRAPLRCQTPRHLVCGWHSSRFLSKSPVPCNSTLPFMKPTCAFPLLPLRLSLPFILKPATHPAAR